VSATVTNELVRSAILDHIGPALVGRDIEPVNVDDDFNLLEAGVIDSFGVLELILSIEAQFGVSLDLEDVDPVELTTVGPLAQIVAEACAGESSPLALAQPTGTIGTAFVSSPTSPTPSRSGAVRRQIGRSFASFYRGALRVYGKGFSVLVSGAFSSFGKATVLQPPIRLSGQDHITVGSGVFVGAGAWFQTLAFGDRERGWITIGDGTSFAGRCTLSAACAIRIGRRVSFAGGVYVADHAHAYQDCLVPVMEQGIKDLAPVEIGDGAWLGQNAVVLPGARIGRGAVVSANSVVAGDVPDFTVVAGAPARVVRRFGSGDQPPAFER
jgi:acetyltransferase-like isoleucine patch superfamily enzyme/acyl carrier protein